MYDSLSIFIRSSFEGVPNIVKINSNCSSELLPGKRTFLSNNSANIQPIDHVSTDLS